MFQEARVNSQNEVELPHEDQAERSLLGGLLLGTPDSVRALDVVRSSLTPDHFYNPRHRLCFSATLALGDRGRVRMW